MSRATAVQLGACQLQSQDILRSLTKMRQLSLLGLVACGVTDLSPLFAGTAFFALTTLDLSANQISDITLLAKQSNLASLYLGCNQITDISPVANLKKLQSLDISYNPVQDIQVLSALPNLRILNIDSCCITDLSPLCKIRTLTDLAISPDQIELLGALMKKPGLKIEVWEGKTHYTLKGRGASSGNAAAVGR